MGLAYTHYYMAFQVAPVVKNLPANAGDVRDAGLVPALEDPLEKDMAAHSRTLAWRIPGAEQPGGLQSRGSQRVGQDEGLSNKRRCRLGEQTLRQGQERVG